MSSSASPGVVELWAVAKYHCSVFLQVIIFIGSEEKTFTSMMEEGR